MKVSNLSLAIGFPLTDESVPSAFFKSFALMDKPDYLFLDSEGATGAIHTLRNNLAQRALIEGVSHLLMMDTDQVYHPLTVTRLLSHKLPVVGAEVPRRYPPFDSILLKAVLGEQFNRYESLQDFPEGELVEVDATGAGCILYDMEVFRKLPPPWFRDDKAPRGAPPIGEDVGFCQDLKAAGYRIFVDTAVPAGHLATFVINRNFQKMYRKYMEAQRLALERAIQKHDLQPA